MSIETRQRVADQVLARMRDRGFPLDGDADLIELISLWTSGAVEMPECRERYLAIVRNRNEALRSGRRPPPPDLPEADDLSEETAVDL